MLKIKRKAKKLNKIKKINKLIFKLKQHAQAETAEKTAMAEVQKQEAISGANVQYEQAKNQMEIQRMNCCSS